MPKLTKLHAFLAFLGLVALANLLLAAALVLSAGSPANPTAHAWMLPVSAAAHVFSFLVLLATVGLAAAGSKNMSKSH
jgi:hypothetical protein